MGHMLQPNYLIILRYSLHFPLWLESHLSLCLKCFPLICICGNYTFLKLSLQTVFFTKTFYYPDEKRSCLSLNSQNTLDYFKVVIIYHLNCFISVKEYLEKYHLSLLWISIMLYHFYETHHTLPYVVVMCRHDVSAIMALRILHVYVYCNA